jgi:DNA helicase-2/ATP-dependent DNA helicase PcrA
MAVQDALLAYNILFVIFNGIRAGHPGDNDSFEDMVSIQKHLLLCGLSQGRGRTLSRAFQSRAWRCSSVSQVEYSEEQLAPITAPCGPIRVMSGPGSGKTRVIVGRILHVLEMQDSDEQSNILAVSFTNKASGEMKKRISECISDPALLRLITCCTFHSWSYKMLRTYGQEMMDVVFSSKNAEWSVMDQDDSLKVMEKVLEENNVDRKETAQMARMLLGRIQRIKNNEGYLNPVDRDMIVRRSCAEYLGMMDASAVEEQVFWTGKYEEALRDVHSVDFEDLIGIFAYLLKRDDFIRKIISARYPHVLVDEFQDVNRIQYDLLKLVCSNSHHLFVVGDVDQAIYSWRGASVDIMRSEFQKDFTNALTFKLRDNYRSTDVILQAGSKIISLVQNSERDGFRAVRDNASEDSSIQIFSHKCPIHESEMIAKQIQEVLLLGCQGRDVAILLRTHSQAKFIETALRHANVPYRLTGGVSFWRRKEIADIIAYLKVAVNPSDEVSFTRVVNQPKRGIGPSAMKKLQEYAESINLKTSEAVLKTEDSSYHQIMVGAKIGGKSKSGLDTFRSIILELSTLASQDNLPNLLEQAINLTQYTDFISNSNEDDSKKQARLSNISHLLRQGAMYYAEAQQDGDTSNHGSVVKSFLDIYTLDDEFSEDETNGNSNAIIVSTMHAAKGLEFNKVWIPGLIDGICPLRSSQDESSILDAWDLMDEETRLLYVAITRAKDSVTLSFPKESLSGYTRDKKPMRTSTRPNTPSRFLRVLGIQILESSHLQ